MSPYESEAIFEQGIPAIDDLFVIVDDVVRGSNRVY